VLLLLGHLLLQQLLPVAVHLAAVEIQQHDSAAVCGTNKTRTKTAAETAAWAGPSSVRGHALRMCGAAAAAAEAGVAAEAVAAAGAGVAPGVGRAAATGTTAAYLLVAGVRATSRAVVVTDEVRGLIHGPVHGLVHAVRRGGAARGSSRNCAGGVVLAEAGLAVAAGAAETSSSRAERVAVAGLGVAVGAAKRGSGRGIGVKQAGRGDESAAKIVSKSAARKRQ
jgi:hypothetical protein